MQRLAAVGSRAGLIVIGGAVLVGLGAVAMSPLFPIGVARKADPDVGLHADWLVLAVGIAIVAAVVLAVAFVAAWRATRVFAHRAAVLAAPPRLWRRPRRGHGARSHQRSPHGAPGRKRRDLRPRAFRVAGAVFGIAGITAVLIFAASLADLVATPRLSGWTFDVKTEVADRPGSVCTDGDADGLTKIPGVVAVAAVCTRDLEVDGHPVFGWGIESLRGRIDPEVVAGCGPPVRAAPARSCSVR